MKTKFLVFTCLHLLFNFSMSQISQTTINTKTNEANQKKLLIFDSINSSYNILDNNNNKVNTSFTPTRVNSSSNAYSMTVSQQNALSTNKDLNLIMLTHRGGPVNGTGGQIISSYSINGGTSWDTVNIVYDGNPNLGRFPSGVIYNPQGNTNVNNAWAVVAGPALTSNGSNWGYDYFAMKRFGTTTPIKYVKDHLNNKRLCRNNMQATNAGTFWMTGDAHTDNGTVYTGYNHVLWKGVFNLGNITWTDQIISPNLLIKPSLGVPAGRPTSSVAFSEDGQIGYFITFGIPAGTNLYYHRPIVKKTINGGQTWVDLPDFNFSNLNQFSQHLPHTSQGNVAPNFDYIKDAIVDKNGQLHILSFIIGGTSTSIDSIDYFVPISNLKSYLFDIYTTDTGWEAELVDIVKAMDVTFAFGDLTFEARPQMAISTDRSKIFYTWSDTQPNMSTSNEYPNLIISAFDVDTKARTESFNVTNNTEHSGKAYLHTTAPQAWQYDTTFIIHNVITELGNSDITPVSYLYLQGIQIHESDFKYVPVSYAVINSNAGGLSASVNNVPINTFSKQLKGTSVTFNANPYSGYSVKQWKVNDTIVVGNHTNTLVLNNIQNRIHVTVEYDYLVTFSVIDGNGTITATANGNTINSGTSIISGQNIVFTANPNVDFVVREWKHNGFVVSGNTSNTYSINNILSSANVTVEFRHQNSSLLTFDVNGGNGTISASVDGFNTLTNSYIENGKDITFNAIPANGYQVKNWKLNNTIVQGNTSTSYVLNNIQQTSDVRVEFEQITHMVTFSVIGGNGSLVASYNSSIISNNSQIPQGANIQFNANPLSNYHVKEWKLNDAVVFGNTSNIFTVNNLQADIIVTVEYEETIYNYYNVSYSVYGGNGNLSAIVDGTYISPGSSVQANKDVVFTAMPNNNFVVKEWKLNNAAIYGNTGNNYTLSNLQEHSTVSVEFKPNDIRIDENGNSSIVIYPNPFVNIFYILSNNFFKMEVLNIQGKVVVEKLIESGLNEIDMSAHQAGVYIIKLSNNDERHIFKINKLRE